MSKFLWIVVPVAAIASLLAGCSKDYTAYALTSNGAIIQFNTSKPTTINSSVNVSGLNTNQSVVQINYQPSSGTLYCVTNDGFLCTVDPTTGDATVITSTTTNPFTEMLGDGNGSVTLPSPVVIGFDPVGGDLRVIATGYNLLVNPDGALDAGFSTAPTNPVVYQSGDTNNGKTPNLVGIAYSNPIAGAGATTLYGLDATTDSLVQIGNTDAGNADSVNVGNIKTIAALDVGISVNTGFTIDQASGTAFASLQDSSAATLYTVNLSSGVLTELGVIGTGDETVTSLVIVPGD